MSIFNSDSSIDKKTVLAVILIFLIVMGSVVINYYTTPPSTAVSVSEQKKETPAAEPKDGLPEGGKPGTKIAPLDTGKILSEKNYTISTNLLEAVFSNSGGDLVSLKLKKHKDKSGIVDLFYSLPENPGALSMAFGPYRTKPIKDLMEATQIGNNSISFYRTYQLSATDGAAQQQFQVKKTYTFKDNEYMFGLEISIENQANEYLPLNFDGQAYTLSFGNQIGPRYEGQAGYNTDIRRYISWSGGKRKEENPKESVAFTLQKQPAWISIVGKYFAFIAIPELSTFTTTLARNKDPVLFLTNTLSFTRPQIKASKQTDSYYFYFGPQSSNELGKYDFAASNAFGRSGLNLQQASTTIGFLSWLEWLLKVGLNFFYSIVKNYGIAIILVTLLVKLILFPLTRKSSIAMSRMQELQPKMMELQAKYKGNPQKLNQEMALFYKKEGYNPLSGCLPLLIQFPIFIAMYNLFNSHFDLRGAFFIPGWIPDLSVPDAIITFQRIDLPLWPIEAIRGLPIIYVISQLLYGKFAQLSSPTQSPTQMKIMMYGVPILFFFILYNTPSGLLLYWIVSNFLSIGQQFYINDMLKKRKATIPSLVTNKPVISKGKQGR